MGGAGAFIWVLVVILGLAWALTQTGTVNLGVNFGLWINLLLVLAVLGAVFNLFIVPFLARTRTTRSTASAAGTATPAIVPGTTPPAGAAGTAASTIVPGSTLPAGAPVSGAAQQETGQETRDRTTL